MRKVKAKTWIRCPGKGWIAIVTINSKENIPNIGDTISIDGFTYKVSDLECKTLSPKSKRRHPDVCIIVNEPPLHRHFEALND